MPKSETGAPNVRSDDEGCAQRPGMTKGCASDDRGGQLRRPKKIRTPQYRTTPAIATRISVVIVIHSPFHSVDIGLGTSLASVYRMIDACGPPFSRSRP